MDANFQGSVFVIIRFPLSLVQTCKNSLSKNFSVHRVYSGSVSGLSRTIQVVEGEWSRFRGVAILSFDSYREALLWKDSVPEIKQQDWLDGVDLIIVPVSKMPSDSQRFIQLMEIDFKDFDQFVNDYSLDTTNYLNAASGACAGVVSTSSINHIKGGWNPPYLIINFWSSPEDFEEAYTAESYQPLKEKRFVAANTNSIIFELEPLFNRR